MAGPRPQARQTPASAFFALSASPRQPLWWLPPLPLPLQRPEIGPQPEGTILRQVFTWAYHSLPAHVWSLPSRRQSDVVLRAVIAVCSSFSENSPGFDYIRRDPKRHAYEYATLMAMRAVEPEDFITSLNREFPDDDYLAATLDPDRRRPPRYGHA